MSVESRITLDLVIVCCRRNIFDYVSRVFAEHLVQGNSVDTRLAHVGRKHFVYMAMLSAPRLIRVLKSDSLYRSVLILNTRNLDAMWQASAKADVQINHISTLKVYDSSHNPKSWTFALPNQLCRDFVSFEHCFMNTMMDLSMCNDMLTLRGELVTNAEMRSYSLTHSRASELGSITALLELMLDRGHSNCMYFMGVYRTGLESLCCQTLINHLLLEY